MLEGIESDRSSLPAYTASDLKLRIVHEPLKLKGNCCITCCLCFTDLVEPLSNEERVIKLTIGFIRKYTRYHPGTDIYSLCIDYVGDASTFDGEQLMSIKKRHREEALQRLERYGDRIKHCKTCCTYYIEVVCCMDYLKLCGTCYLMFAECCQCSGCWLCVLLCVMVKDVVMLITITTNDCDAMMPDDSKYVSFDVDSWMIIAAIGDLIYYLLTCITCIKKENCRVKITWCGIGVICCFFVAWVMVGFLLYSEMSGNTECGVVVLLWCILRAIEIPLTMSCMYHTLYPRQYSMDYP